MHIRIKTAAGKTAAVLMICLLLCAFLFSVIYIIAESHHDCSGEDCPICMLVRQCASGLDVISYVKDGHSSTIVLLCVLLFCVSVSASDHMGFSLVSDKIRLDN